MKTYCESDCVQFIYGHCTTDWACELVGAELQRGFMVARFKAMELERDAWRDARDKVQRHLDFIEGLCFPCPNCGTKTVMPDPTGGYKGKCNICMMEFSMPLLEQMRREGKLDIGITARLQSLQSELSRVKGELEEAQDNHAVHHGETKP